MSSLCSKKVVFIDGEGVVILWSDECDNNDGGDGGV